MKKLLLSGVLSLLCSISGFGQLNSFKYIIIPVKFQGFSSDNQFRTSTLVSYLFTNEGFTTVYSNNLPDDLKKNRCLGARVELVDNSGLFKTKTQLSLTDCSGVLVMMSQEGETRTKDLEQAYREALSESFGSFRGLNYKYEPLNEEQDQTSDTVTLNFKGDVKSLEPEVDSNTSSSETEKTSDEKIVETTSAKSVGNQESSDDILYAQPIEGGFQLVDNTPKVVYILKSTSVPEVFMVNTEGKNGVVFKNEEKWFIEIDEKGSKAKELNIKF